MCGVLFYLHTCDTPTAMNIFGPYLWRGTRIKKKEKKRRRKAAVTVQEMNGLLVRSVEAGRKRVEGVGAGVEEVG